MVRIAVARACNERLEFRLESIMTTFWNKNTYHVYSQKCLQELTLYAVPKHGMARELDFFMDTEGDVGDNLSQKGTNIDHQGDQYIFFLQQATVIITIRLYHSVVYWLVHE